MDVSRLSNPSEFSLIPENQILLSTTLPVDSATAQWLEPTQSTWGKASTTAIAFVDTTLADYDLLAQGMAPGTTVYLLDPMQDAIGQITNTLLQYQGLSSLHIFSHGAAGQLQLGATTLDTQRLNTDQATFQSWAKAFTADADILLYGCDVGLGTLGSEFLSRFAALTTADLAASSDLTGHTALGGNWTLEVNTGDIAAAIALQAPAQAAYHHILPNTLVSQTTGGTLGNNNSWTVNQNLGASLNTNTGTWERDVNSASRNTISDDGRYMVFTSTASNLAPTDTNGLRDVFLRDTVTGETILVSSALNNLNSTGNAASYHPVISGDGNYVAFVSSSNNLVSRDTNSPGGTGTGFNTDIFLWNRATRTTTLVSRNRTNTDSGVGDSIYPSISRDGKTVAFSSLAWNMINGRDLFRNNVYAYTWTTDFRTGTVELASQTNNNIEGNGASASQYPPIVSANGRYVVFASLATNLIDLNNDNTPDTDNNTSFDIFVRDLVTDRTTLVNVNLAGTGNSNQIAIRPTISDDGRYVSFLSQASNLVSSVTVTSNRQTYVRDLVTNTTILASVKSDGTPFSAWSDYAVLSGDGTAIAFTSGGSGVPSDTNNANDVYHRNFTTNTTTLVSVNATNTGAGNGGSSANPDMLPSISGDGRYVAFTSAASNLTTLPDTNGTNDVFLRDLVEGSTTLISINPTRTGSANRASDFAALSRFGTVVAFSSDATNIVNNDTNGTRDVFFYRNAPPVAVPDTVGLNEDTPANGNVLTNDTDFENDFPLSATLVTSTSNGSLTFNANGTFNYTPNANFNGIDTFTYYAVDKKGNLSNTATVTLSVTAVNDAPIATNDSFGLNEDTPVNGNILSNDTDVEGTPLTASLVAGPSNGTLSLNPNGTFSYTPNANYNGTDSFTYIAVDGLGAPSGTATVNFSVTAVNDAPIATNDSFGLNEDTPVNGNILSNDTDVEGTPLTASLVAGPSNGTLSLNPDGTFSYTPNANYNGTDSFTYIAVDSLGAPSGTATVNFSVTAIPDAPIATNDSFGLNEEGSTSGNVLSNDTDPDNNIPLTASLIAGPGNGTLSLNPDGTFNYTPNANFNGTDSFTYIAVDSTGSPSGTATVNLSVTAVNDAPIATDDTYIVPNTAVVTIPAAGVLANDTDIDTPANGLSATLVNGTSQGNLTLNPNGSFVYTANPGFLGTDSFTYRVNDGGTVSNLATVTLTVTDGSNLRPIANNDTATGNEDTAIAGNVLGNDTDPDNNSPLTASLVAGPANGTLSFNADGTFNYTPNANYNGVDSFTYRVRDALGDGSNTATVALTVNPVNDAPTFVSGPNQTAIAGSGTKTVNNWATGFNPGPTNEASQTLVSYGIASNSNPSLFTSAPTISNSGTLIYTPVADLPATGTAVIGVTARDSGGTANGGTDVSPIQFFTVVIAPPPRINVTGVSQNEGNSGNTAYNFTVSLSASSLETISVSYNTADGSATTADNDYVAKSGTLVFLPGETSKVITVNGVGDTKLEATETFTVNLSTTSNAVLTSNNAVGTLTNDDTTPTITIGALSQREGNTGFSNFVFTVSLSNPSSQTVSVNYATADGTATKANNDYFDAIGTLVFAPGETRKTIAVTVAGDTRIEKTETFSVNLTNVVNATLATPAAIGSIVNDDSVANSDFNGDGIDDIVWRNYQTGENMVWLMNGSIPTSTLMLPSLSTNWVLEGAGDFNGDGKPDLLWREYTSGATYFWLMNGTSIESTVALAPAVPPNWIIEGVADFNGDGQLDLIWRDNQSGTLAIWLMNGTTYSSYSSLGQVPMDWVLDGFGDLNNDGQIDLIWRYGPTGYTGAWLLYGPPGAYFYTGVNVSSPGSASWGIVDVGDYNKDGKADIVWRNYASGENYIWFMNGTTATGQAPLYTLGSGWDGV